MNSTYSFSRSLVLLSIIAMLAACGDGKGDEVPPQTPDNDTIAPVITITGKPSISLVVGSTYVEQGATAVDNVDGTVAVDISGEVDTSKVGDYLISYTASDKAGNTATQVRKITVEAPRPFVTRWDTRKGGVSEDNQITISTQGTDINYNIDWGDGSSEQNIQGDITHTYEKAGEYTVKITGQLSGLLMAPVTEVMEQGKPTGTYSYTTDNHKLLAVEDWGSVRWQTMQSAFRSTQVEIRANNQPYLDNVTDMSAMFACDSDRLSCAIEVDVSDWDVSTITNMSDLFAGSKFNGNLATWDVSKVTNMSNMFARTAFFDGNISAWDVSNVTDMSGMFENAQAFNQDIGGWKVTKVASMSNMFKCDSSANTCLFNQALNAWDVDNVKDMSGMFQGNEVFNQDLSSWEVKQVTSMASMFNGSKAFNQDLSSWDVSEVTNMASMFQFAERFDRDISGWKVDNVTNMSGLFRGAKAFNQDLSNWNVAAVTDMSYLFNDAQHFNQNITEWKVDNVTDMSYMFSNAKAFNQDIGEWNVSNVEGMSYMFFCVKSDCQFDQSLAQWNVAKVTHMWQMFDGITLSTQNYSNMLDGWSDLTLQQGVNFHGGSSKYNAFGRVARINISEEFGWTITDAGFAN